MQGKRLAMDELEDNGQTRVKIRGYMSNLLLDPVMANTLQEPLSVQGPFSASALEPYNQRMSQEAC